MKRSSKHSPQISLHQLVLVTGFSSFSWSALVSEPLTEKLCEAGKACVLWTQRQFLGELHVFSLSSCRRSDAGRKSQLVKIQ